MTSDLESLTDRIGGRPTGSEANQRVTLSLRLGSPGEAKKLRSDVAKAGPVATHP